jgi:hypothetical protein
MSAAPMHMLLRTSQEAPCFCGAAINLSHYIAEVESLCQTCQWASDTELVKLARYYTDEASWDTWTAVRDTLADPASWHDLFQGRNTQYVPDT